MVTTQDVNLFRAAQDETVRLAQQEFAQLWEQLDGLAPARKRDALLDLMPALIRKWQDVGGTAAAQWYETVRAYYFDDLFDAVLPEPPDVDAYDDEIRRLVRWQAGLLWDTDEQPADPQRFRTFLNNMVEHNIRDTGRQTIKENAGRDRRHDSKGVRFARVSQPGCCAWCALLGSRGYVYHTDETAEAASHYNKHTGKLTCKCEIIPEFERGSNRIEGYDPDALYDRYDDARRAIEDGLPDDWLHDMEAQGIKARASDPNALAYVMRRQHPDEYSDGVAA